MMIKRAIFLLMLVGCAALWADEVTQPDSAPVETEIQPDSTTAGDTAPAGTAAQSENADAADTAVQSENADAAGTTESASADTTADAGSGAAASANQGGGTPVQVSYSVLHNQYYEASVKERSLARLTMNQGNYDESIFHSSEAERLAKLSDEYINKMMLRARANKAIAEASRQIAWARQNEAETYYPNEFAAATGHYTVALDAKKKGDWDSALENALAVANDLAAVTAPPKAAEAPKDMPPNPNKYTVRPWDKFGDCFWNIAKWFYKDPWKWPILYRANKDKLPDPNNPNLLPVGTIIDIPSIGNETRVGMYDTGTPYRAQN